MRYIHIYIYIYDYGNGQVSSLCGPRCMSTYELDLHAVNSLDDEIQTDTCCYVDCRNRLLPCGVTQSSV